MEDRAVQALAAVLPPLLAGLDALEIIARYLNPPDLAGLVAAAEPHGAALAAARPALNDIPDATAGLRGLLETTCDEVLAAFTELSAAAQAPDAMFASYRALRHAPRAQEALYPLARFLPPVNRFFLAPDARGDDALQARLMRAEMRDDTGFQHAGEPGARGGFSLYVPETYQQGVPHPLIFALHGGAGSGRGFIWSWLREARSAGAILVAPTAVGDTWALAGPDIDTPNLMRILSIILGHWTIDTSRVLLTGMSDGGTFSYVSGLEEGSPFTHLAPVSAAFHPMLASAASPARVQGLPIFLTHGALDWMFPIAMAREAAAALQAAGAALHYREVDDLAHTYPREINGEILDWLRGG